MNWPWAGLCPIAVSSLPPPSLPGHCPLLQGPSWNLQHQGRNKDMLPCATRHSFCTRFQLHHLRQCLSLLPSFIFWLVVVLVELNQLIPPLYHMRKLQPTTSNHDLGGLYPFNSCPNTSLPSLCLSLETCLMLHISWAQKAITPIPIRETKSTLDISTGTILDELHRCWCWRRSCWMSLNKAWNTTNILVAGNSQTGRACHSWDTSDAPRAGISLSERRELLILWVPLNMAASDAQTLDRIRIKWYFHGTGFLLLKY